MVDISFADFNNWLSLALASYGREKMSFRYQKGCQIGLFDPDDETFARVLIWNKPLIELIPLLYKLYVEHSSVLNDETLQDEFLTKYRLFWKFVRSSRELMALPFFQKLYPSKMAEIDPNFQTIQEFQAAFEKNCRKCSDLGLTAELIYNSTVDELKWALKQDRMFLTVSEKLQILQIHRQYCQ